MKKIYTSLVLIFAFTAIGLTTYAQDFVINPGGMVTVYDGSSIHVTGTGNQLIINSPTNSGAAGSLMNLSNTAGNITATGNVEVNRFLSRYEWHMLTSPVANMDASNFNFVSNNFLSYHEPNRSWVDAASLEMNENEGYFAYSNYQMLTFAGALYSSEPITVSNKSMEYVSQVGDPAVPTGWHMLGNKYTCAIDLSQVTTVAGDNIHNTIYLWDQATGDYLTFNLNGAVDPANSFNGIIAPGQAFFYKVTADANNTITIPHGAKLHSTDVIFMKKKNKKVLDNTLSLKITGNGITNNMKVIFNSKLKNVTEGFDSEYDAVKMYPFEEKTPELYTLTNTNALLATDVRPEEVMEDYTIPMGFRVQTAGTYTIDVSEFTFAADFPVILEDNYTGERVELDNSSTYTFTSDAGQFDGRFSLLFNPMSVPTGIENNLTAVKIYTNKKDLYINLNTADLNNSRVEVYNLVGTKILDKELTSNQTVLSLDVQAGDYIVKVISGVETKVSKVFVN